jgi:hypothetical protein
MIKPVIRCAPHDIGGGQSERCRLVNYRDLLDECIYQRIENQDNDRHRRQPSRNGGNPARGAKPAQSWKPAKANAANECEKYGDADRSSKRVRVRWRPNAEKGGTVTRRKLQHYQ